MTKFTRRFLAIAPWPLLLCGLTMIQAQEPEKPKVRVPILCELPARLRKAAEFTLSCESGGGGRTFRRCPVAWRSRIC